ncbi:hypothetical protein C8Q76DRAFT_784089 [Earliella scabrosa]|nr:hypothetical protein C8Q76DRAFT_784089 [Earliella scabrosa]
MIFSKSSVVGSLALALSLFSQAVSAEQWVPQVLEPNGSTPPWQAGQLRNVTWDTSNPPAQIDNPFGTVMLAKGGRTTPLILVQLVPLERGFAPVRVPWVEKGDDYQIVLFGDENNLGPIFTIGVDENAE